MEVDAGIIGEPESVSTTSVVCFDWGSGTVNFVNKAKRSLGAALTHLAHRASSECLWR